MREREGSRLAPKTTGWITVLIIEMVETGQEAGGGTEIKSCVLTILSLTCLSDSMWRC